MNFQRLFTASKVWAENWTYISHTRHSTTAGVAAFSSRICKWSTTPDPFDGKLVSSCSHNTTVIFLAVMAWLLCNLCCYDHTPWYKSVAYMGSASTLLTPPRAGGPRWCKSRRHLHLNLFIASLGVLVMLLSSIARRVGYKTQTLRSPANSNLQNL